MPSPSLLNDQPPPALPLSQTTNSLPLYQSANPPPLPSLLNYQPPPSHPPSLPNCQPSAPSPLSPSQTTNPPSLPPSQIAKPLPGLFLVYLKFFFLTNRPLLVGKGLLILALLLLLCFYSVPREINLPVSFQDGKCYQE